MMKALRHPSHAREDAAIGEVPIGFLVPNKDKVHWIEQRTRNARRIGSYTRCHVINRK
jgi:hypothetical protein